MFTTVPTLTKDKIDAVACCPDALSALQYVSSRIVSLFPLLIDGETTATVTGEPDNHLSFSSLTFPRNSQPRSDTEEGATAYTIACCVDRLRFTALSATIKSP